MTPEELDLLQEELEEYLPTSLQVKLGKVLDTIRNPPTNEALAAMNGLVILEIRKDTSSRNLNVTFTGMCKTVKAEQLIHELYYKNTSHPTWDIGRYHSTWDSFTDYPKNYHKNSITKSNKNQNKTEDKPDQNYGLSA